MATTDSGHDGPIFPDLAKDAAPDRPNQLWVADLTYVAVPGGFVCLAAILDAWSRKVVGYAISRSIGSQFAGARDPAGPPALGQVLQPVAGGNELHRHPVRRRRVLLPDVGPYPRQVGQGRCSEGDYRQGGGGSSVPVPQDSSQRRTAS